MKVIDNLNSDRDHGVRFKDLIAVSDELVFASPFLMSDFSPWFSELDLGHLGRFHLITTLQPHSHDQLSKMDALVSFIECASSPSKQWDYEISLNNRLHGKVYVFKKSGVAHTVILSSANLTNNGLRNNHEWGVEITESEHVVQLERDVLGAVQYRGLSEKEIMERHAIADAYAQKHPDRGDGDMALDLTQGLRLASPTVHPLPSIFLKPIGSSDNLVGDDWVFNEEYDHMDFSKKRPNSVKPGDIVVAYASGTGRLLSVFEVNSAPQYSSDVEMKEHSWKVRWPWYVKAKNLTPRFGTTWNRHNITTAMLKDEYLKEHPEGSVSSAGGKTLGAFSFGADRLQLDADFGKYILQRLQEIMGVDEDPALTQVTDQFFNRFTGTVAP